MWAILQGYRRREGSPASRAGGPPERSDRAPTGGAEEGDRIIGEGDAATCAVNREQSIQHTSGQRTKINHPVSRSMRSLSYRKAVGLDVEPFLKNFLGSCQGCELTVPYGMSEIDSRDTWRLVRSVP